MTRCKKNLKYMCVLKKMLNFATKYAETSYNYYNKLNLLKPNDYEETFTFCLYGNVRCSFWFCP